MLCLSPLYSKPPGSGPSNPAVQVGLPRIADAGGEQLQATFMGGFGFTATPMLKLLHILTSLLVDSCSINSINLTMEPTFAETTSETVTAELRAQLDAAVAAIPPTHHCNPSRDEVFESKEAAFVHLQDWTFTKGFAIVKESAKTKNGQVNRLYLDCIHHRKNTKNSRKLKEVDRKRLQTKT